MAPAKTRLPGGAPARGQYQQGDQALVQQRGAECRGQRGI
jgi:hypothetical protein